MINNMIKYLLKSIKRNIILIILFFFMLGLIMFSSSNLAAAKSGLSLWYTSIVPSLLPFFIATELLSNTEIPYILGRLFNPLMNPLFNVKGEGSFALLFGIICGYPVGAKITCNLRNQGILNQNECERLLSFVNTSNPMFILGTVGISLYGSTTIGIILLIAHILAAITVGFIFRFWKITNKNSEQNNILEKQQKKENHICFSNFGDILSKSIYTSISNVTMIGGFVVLFSVIISIAKSSHFFYILITVFSPILKILSLPPSLFSPFITGFLEITNGIFLVSSVNIKTILTKIVLTSFLLGFGGLSIFMQIFCIVSKEKISIKPYLYGKLLQGVISSIYTFLLFQFFNSIL